jgi:hypothetical protein
LIDIGDKKNFSDAIGLGRQVKYTGFSGEQLAIMLTIKAQAGGHGVPFYSVVDASYPH